MLLKEERNRKKISQQEIADFLNISQRTYSAYELGQTEPNIDTLCKLADYYDISLDYLVGRKWKNDPGYMDEMQLNFVKLYLSLTRENQNKLFGYAMALYGEQK